MDRVQPFWLYQLSNVVLRRWLPGRPFRRLLLLFLGAVIVAPAVSILLCLPQPPRQTLSCIMVAPTSPGGLLFLATTGCIGAILAAQYGFASMQGALRGVRSHVITAASRDMLWGAACEAGRAANRASPLLILTAAYPWWVCCTETAAPWHTKVGLAALLGGAWIIGWSGVVLLWRALSRLFRLRKPILAGLTFDPMDPEFQGGIGRLLRFVEKCVLLWFVLSLLVLLVALSAWSRGSEALPVRERIAVASFAGVLLLANLAMGGVWWRGARWIEEEKAEVRRSLLKRIRAYWNVGGPGLAEATSRLHFLELSGAKLPSRRISLVLSSLFAMAEFAVFVKELFA